MFSLLTSFCIGWWMGCVEEAIQRERTMVIGGLWRNGPSCWRPSRPSSGCSWERSAQTRYVLQEPCERHLSLCFYVEMSLHRVVYWFTVRQIFIINQFVLRVHSGTALGAGSDPCRVHLAVCEEQTGGDPPGSCGQNQRHLQHPAPGLRLADESNSCNVYYTQRLTDTLTYAHTPPLPSFTPALTELIVVHSRHFEGERDTCSLPSEHSNMANRG